MKLSVRQEFMDHFGMRVVQGAVLALVALVAGVLGDHAVARAALLEHDFSVGADADPLFQAAVAFHLGHSVPPDIKNRFQPAFSVVSGFTALGAASAFSGL